MVFAQSGSIYSRTLIHPDRNDWAPRIGFSYSPWVPLGSPGGLTAFSTFTPCGRDAKGCWASIRRFLWTTLLSQARLVQTAVASAAPFRLGGWLSGRLLDPNALSPTVYRRADDPNQRSPLCATVQFRNSTRTYSEFYYSTRRMSATKGRSFLLCETSMRQALFRNPNGTQSAGARPYAGFGDIQWAENRASSSYNSFASRFGEEILARLERTAQLYMVEDANRRCDQLSTIWLDLESIQASIAYPQNTDELRAGARAR
jgi:hypothetical protein